MDDRPRGVHGALRGPRKFLGSGGPAPLRRDLAGRFSPPEAGSSVAASQPELDLDVGGGDF